MSDDRNLRGHAAIFAANALWGLNASICKTVLNELSTLTVTTFRMVGAALVFWIFSLFLPKEHVHHRDMLKLFFAALLGVVLNQGLFAFGLDKTTSLDASIVTTATPIITMIIAAIYLKEPITSMKVMGIFTAAIGVLVLITTGTASVRHPGNTLGDLLCLIAQFSFAFYLVLFKDLMSKYSPITISKWLFIYASMCFIPFSYADIVSIDFGTFSLSLWLHLGYVVVGSTFLAYICLMSSQRLLRPTIVSMYNYIQPIMVAILMMIMGIENFSWEKLVAIALIVAGVFYVTLSKSRDDFEQEGREL
jgi:drug/metabolite transporter (DMT)-like permease